MSFQVLIEQRPEGRSAMLTTTEMSMDSLQLKLIKDIHSIISVNGQRLTIAQKEAIRQLGTRYEVTDLRNNGGASVLVTLRREGHMRTMSVGQSGIAHFADGHGYRVRVNAQDPLNSAPWGADLTEGVQW